MGDFRDRMERDLQIRGFSRSTQQCYLARMKAMVRFFMRPPDELTLEDIHSYQLHLTRDRKVCWSSFNQSVGAICGLGLCRVRLGGFRRLLGVW